PPSVTVAFIRVLQQIAIGYVIAFLVLHLGPRVQAATAAGLLVLHTLAFVLLPDITGYPWQKGFNFCADLDEWLHLPFNKYGYVTFNAISSTSTILFGVLCGELLRSEIPPPRKLLVLLVAGLGGLLAGAALTPMVPMVKKLWTSSFTLYAAGWTCLMLGAFY